MTEAYDSSATPGRAHSIQNSISQFSVLVFLVIAGISLVIWLALAIGGGTASNIWQAFIIPFGVGVVYYSSAVWLYVTRRQLTSGRVFVVFAAAVAMVCAGWFDHTAAQHLTGLWILGIAMSGGAIFSLAFCLPEEDAALQKAAILRYAGYVAAFLLWTYSLIALAVKNEQSVSLAIRINFGFATLALLFALAWLAFRRYPLGSAIDKEQLKIVLAGALIAFLPLLMWFLIAWLLPGKMLFSAYWLLPMIVFPAALGYAIQRYHMMQLDTIISRSVLYGILAIMVVGGYALLVAGVTLLTGAVLRPDNPLLVGAAIFTIALLFNPLKKRLEDILDRTFFQGDRAYQAGLKTFSGDLTQEVDLLGIVKVLRRYVEQSLAPSQVHIFLLDSLGDQYAASKDENGKPTSDLKFGGNSPLVAALAERHSPVFIADLAQPPAELSAEKARLALLQAQYHLPLPGRQRLAGWLSLGPRLSGEPYSSRDISFVEALCDQAALAIERAQVIGKMESRVREMNVLTRVAQGVNVTLTLDDIFELVYAQTTQIVPADDFTILLYDRQSHLLKRAFYIENDERLVEYENQPVGTQNLEQEIIQGRRAVVAGDYLKECQNRGILPEKTGLYAWMCVPLNAGAETIGSLSLGSRHPSVAYSQEQLNLVQAIADQVAGAITKARVLDESERRARQLSTMNDMTRQLTSTLDVNLLLERILQSAVEILNCEAGSLLMVDEQTEDLVYSATSGQAVAHLLNTRLPAGSGIAGQAAHLQAPVIQNNVQEAPEWFARSEQETGFTPHGILVVPMVVKERAIGVLEVINKKDGSPFIADDQELLEAFASQAGVAIENARLYTLTDLALAARVEELSVMQRIDRELNASLDVKVAMQITLEWAMRQSGASAGLVGMTLEDGLRIMASQGYGTELSAYAEELMPTDAFHIQDVITSGQAYRADHLEGGLLQAARSQVLVPIRREANTIGLVILESTEPEAVTEEMLNFLTRLTDHASIAISNAQLYTAVQAANVAKSEFVSFVAHELKNPMTSIKGYTELLAAGAVGPINEAQTNFLQTIRANIERMNTLISDLNDLSKIEAGRLRLDFKSVVIKEVVDEVVRSTKRQIDDKKQTLTVSLPDDLPSVWADRVRLVQVVVNLVSNAHKYTEAGGQVTIGAARTDNQWDQQGSPVVVHLWVQDSGIGISPEDQAKIFQKFFRSDDPKTREAPGTGLGLNITKSLVEMMGGKIWFESEFRKGTTFHITIPVSE